MRQKSEIVFIYFGNELFFQTHLICKKNEGRHFDRINGIDHYSTFSKVGPDIFL